MNESAGSPQGRPSGLVMGRPFGIPVYVSPTWFIVAAAITYLYEPLVEARLPDLGNLGYLVAFAFAVLLYVSVFVHELSHSVVALAFGLPVRRITLYMLGGVSEIEREPDTPGREFLVAFAGPVLSLVIAVGAFAAYKLAPLGAVVNLLAYELALANALVGVFNLLPGLPLDGGRLLRAAVWKLTRRPFTGTLVAAWSGRGLGAVVFIAPIAATQLAGGTPSLFNIAWGALLGSFIWIGASQSLRSARVRERLPQVHARTLARRAVPVHADVPLAEALRRTYDAGAGALVIVDGADKPIALVNEAAVRATPVERRPWITVGGMARSLEPGMILPADLVGRELLTRMRTTPSSEYLLVESGGEIYGVLATSDVDRAFAGV